MGGSKCRFRKRAYVDTWLRIRREVIWVLGAAIVRRSIGYVSFASGRWVNSKCRFRMEDGLVLFVFLV